MSPHGRNALVEGDPDQSRNRKAKASGVCRRLRKLVHRVKTSLGSFWSGMAGAIRRQTRTQIHLTVADAHDIHEKLIRFYRMSSESNFA